MNSSILIDTGPLVAILSPKDDYHQICIDTLKILKSPLLTTWPVITETHWLTRQNSKIVTSLFKMIEGNVIQVLDLPSESIPWMKNFLLKYEDTGAQIADVSLCYFAEAYKIDTIFTLDKRDFAIYRIKNNRYLNIIPKI
jgi:predicted nucleic acid-binding protein